MNTNDEFKVHTTNNETFTYYRVGIPFFYKIF